MLRSVLDHSQSPGLPVFISGIFNQCRLRVPLPHCILPALPGSPGKAATRDGTRSIARPHTDYH